MKPQISVGEQAIYLAIPDDGQSHSFSELKQKMGSDFKVRAFDALAQSELVHHRGGTQGGTLTKLPFKELSPQYQQLVKQIASTSPYMKVDRPWKPEELSLYVPLAQILQQKWAPQKGFTDPARIWVTDTSHKGGTQYGQFERPDLALFGFHGENPVANMPQQELIIFEVKPYSEISQAALSQAENQVYKCGATRGYLIFWVPPQLQLDLNDELLQLAQDAKRVGPLGVIVVSDPADFSTWDEIQKATIQHPDPARMSDFIAACMPSIPILPTGAGMGAPEAPLTQSLSQPQPEHGGVFEWLKRKIHEATE